METTRETVYEADSEKILGAVMSNAEMAKHAVITVLGYVNREDLKSSLKDEIIKYDGFIERAKSLAGEKCIEIQKPSKIGKFAAEKMIKLKLLFDKSNCKIVEMLVKGTTNGDIDMAKAIKIADKADEQAITLAKELLTYEENEVNKMRHFI